MVYLQVNALGEWIIGIYLHEFSNNEREISIPYEAVECGIEKFREEFVNHSPAARDLQILLVFYQHPAWFISL